jgi:arginyl-tRNA synthetase
MRSLGALSIERVAATPDPDPLAALRASVLDAAEGLDGAAGGRATLERPPKPELGDYSTNAAMLLAPTLRSPPREVAERLRDELASRLGASAERIEVAGPGFVNVFLSDRWHREATAGLLAAGDRFAADRPERPLRVLVEFVSANPTGPATAASGRGGAFGDSVARLLELAGHEVEREYYLNDAGSQVRLFAESIAARMRGDEPPADGYAGEYVAELAAELAATGASADDLDQLASRGTEAMRERIATTLERFRIRFDNWFSEHRLYEARLIDAAIAELRERGHVFEREGAVWLRTSELGDDKDRVLIRADGEPTYFAADVAYHRDKVERGAERMITPLGADHHGYVPRMRAALVALGIDPDRYEAPIMQLINIVEGGQRARMSKRKADFVTLDELIDDIGVDAARFFMVQRSHDTAFDLDLDLARSASQDNPVYYVQYAHARIASILRKAAAEGGGGEEAAVAEAGADESSLSAAAEPAERALLRRLLELPGEVRAAGERRAPHRLTAYAMATAADFHAFYRDCRVVGAGQGLEAARLALCVATKRTVATTLGLIGVGAPDQM